MAQRYQSARYLAVNSTLRAVEVCKGTCNGNDDIDEDSGANVAEIALETEQISL
jgi:hypothetical protein